MKVWVVCVTELMENTLAHMRVYSSAINAAVGAALFKEEVEGDYMDSVYEGEFDDYYTVEIYTQEVDDGM